VISANVSTATLIRVPFMHLLNKLSLIHCLFWRNCASVCYLLWNCAVL